MTPTSLEYEIGIYSLECDLIKSTGTDVFLLTTNEIVGGLYGTPSGPESVEAMTL